MSIASWTSPRASLRTFPISMVTSRESASLRASIISAARNRISARRGAGVARQRGYASAAAATASATSSGPESGKEPIASPVAGFSRSKRLSLFGGDHLPAMKFSQEFAMPHLQFANARAYLPVDGRATYMIAPAREGVIRKRYARRSDPPPPPPPPPPRGGGGRGGGGGGARGGGAGAGGGGGGGAGRGPRVVLDRGRGGPPADEPFVELAMEVVHA